VLILFALLAGGIITFLGSMTDGVRAFREIAVGGAAIIGASVAYLGLEQWRSEKLWHENRMLAKRLASEVMRLAKRVNELRSPWFDEELSTMENVPNKYDEAGKPTLYAKRIAYWRRWEKFDALLNQLSEYLIEAEAVWGGEFVEAWQGLDDELGRLKIAAELSSEFGRMVRRDGTVNEHSAKADAIAFRNLQDDPFIHGFVEAKEKTLKFLKSKLDSRP
jgi:hypothetical protein